MLPETSWINATQIDVAAARGDTSSPLVRMSDGSLETFSGSKSFNQTISGAGGMVSAVDPGSSFVHLYLVKSGGALVVVGDVAKPPPLGAGPTGFTGKHRYIATVYNGSGGSDLLKYHQRGNKFFRVARIEPSTIAALTKTSLVNPAQAFDISDVVPATAAAVMAEMFVQVNTTGNGAIEMNTFVDGDIDMVTGGTTPNSAFYMNIATNDEQFAVQFLRYLHPVPDDPPTIGLRVFTQISATVVSFAWTTHGWVDAFR